VRAGALLDEAIEEARAVGGKARVAKLLVNRAVLRAVEGRPAAARAALDESERLASGELDDEFRAVRVVARATLALGEGRLDDARRELDGGIAALRARGEPHHRMLAWLLRLAGQVARERGDFFEAQARLSEAREGAAVAHDAIEGALAQLASIRLLVDEGHDSQADAELSRALPWLARMGLRDGEALAHALSARAELVRVERPPPPPERALVIIDKPGRPDEARAAANRAIARLSATGDLFVAAELRTVAARASAAGRDADARAESRRALEALVAELTRVGYVGLTWDARLAAVTLTDGAARRAAAGTLAREATAAGFVRVAHAAERLAAPEPRRRAK